MIQWVDAAQTILYAQVSNPFDWTDSQAARSQLTAMMQNKRDKVRFVVEIAPDLSLPPGGLPQNTQAAVALHDQVAFDEVVYTLLNPALVPIWQAALQTYTTTPERYIVVTSRAEGAKWLQR